MITAMTVLVVFVDSRFYLYDALVSEIKKKERKKM